MTSPGVFLLLVLVYLAIDWVGLYRHIVHFYTANQVKHQTKTQKNFYPHPSRQIEPHWPLLHTVKQKLTTIAAVY